MKKPHSLPILLALLGAAALIFPACTANRRATAAPIPTKTGQVTATRRPTRTMIFPDTETPTPPPTMTPTSTPTLPVAFQKARLYGYGYQNDWRETWITIRAGEPLSGEYYADVNGLQYTCRVSRAIPQHVTCSGPAVGIEKKMQVMLYEKSRKQLVFETSFSVPISLIFPPTKTPQ